MFDSLARALPWIFCYSLFDWFLFSSFFVDLEKQIALTCQLTIQFKTEVCLSKFWTILKISALMFAKCLANNVWSFGQGLMFCSSLAVSYELIGFQNTIQIQFTIFDWSIRSTSRYVFHRNELCRSVSDVYTLRSLTRKIFQYVWRCFYTIASVSIYQLSPSVCDCSCSHYVLATLLGFN